MLALLMSLMGLAESTNATIGQLPENACVSSITDEAKANEQFEDVIFIDSVDPLVDEIPAMINLDEITNISLSEALPGEKESVIPSSIQLGVNENYAFQTGKKATYKSSKPKIAAVSKKGIVTAKKTGTTVITVKKDGKKIGKCKVHVMNAPKKVKLSMTKMWLSVGETDRLEAILPENTASRITWTSSKKKVATVDAEGNITAIAKGTTTITAKTFNGKKATCTLKVQKGPVPISIEFIPNTITIGKKESVTIEPVLNEGAETTFTWSTKNKKIATVTKSGIITGKKIGSTKVTVTTHNGLSAVLTVKVLDAPSKISLNSKRVSLTVGGTYQLIAKLPKKTASRIAWKSGDKTIATVDANGVITAVSSGTTTVKATTFNKKKATCKITVTELVPTPTPTEEPTEEPTPTPTPTETPLPSDSPSPSLEPSAEPSDEPTSVPTVDPTDTPTEEPTVEPSEQPSISPTESPAPSVEPSIEPSVSPETTESPEPSEPPIVSDFLVDNGILIGYTGEGGDIVIPNENEAGYLITTIGASVFAGRSDINSVTISNSIIEIGESAFDGCTSLIRIRLSKNVSQIGKAAFRNCVSLKQMIYSD